MKKFRKLMSAAFTVAMYVIVIPLVIMACLLDEEEYDRIVHKIGQM